MMIFTKYINSFPNQQFKLEPDKMENNKRFDVDGLRL